MTSGFAITCVNGGQAAGGLRGISALRGLVFAALMAGLLPGQAALAQDLSASGGGAAGFGATDADRHDGMRDAGGQTDPMSDTMSGQISDAGRDLETDNDNLPDADGIGLIEAPSNSDIGLGSVAAESTTSDNTTLDSTAADSTTTDSALSDMAPASQDGGALLGGGALLDGSAVATFAERRTAQARTHLFGPISHPPVVVELFTSQGCSSCPPADEMLADLAERDDVLALSWHVDYWDYLGWADQFASPDFTARQQDYAHAWRERAIYTPQVIIGGTDTLIALRPAELMSMIDAQMARPVPVLVNATQQDGSYRIELTPRAQIRDRVAILLVRYAPDRQVTIKAGENRGVSVRYRNVVLAVERIGDWDGRAPLRMSVKAAPVSDDAFPPDTRHVILAQQLGRDQRPTGPILAAVRLD